MESAASRLISASLVAATSALAVAPSSPLRRAARASAEAVRKILTSASGSTVVPMSRPSTTMPWGAAAAMERWSAVMAERTSGTALTALTREVTSGVRIGPEASVPSTVMPGAAGSVPDTITGLPATAATAEASVTSMSLLIIHHVIARYCAPVSRKLMPSRVATAFEVLDLPVPDGPSMATITAGPVAEAAVAACAAVSTGTDTFLGGAGTKGAGRVRGAGTGSRSGAPETSSP